MGPCTAVGLGDLEHLTDPRPGATQGAQLGDGDELVGRRRHAEVDPAEGLGRGDARLVEMTHVVQRGREGEGDLVLVGGAGVMVDAAVDGDRADARPALGARGHGLGEGGEVRRGPARRRQPDRVVAEAAADDGGVDPLRLPGGDERRSRGGLIGERGDDDRGEVDHDVGENLGDVTLRDTVWADVEPDRADPLLEVVEDGLARGRRVRVVVPLAHVPRQVGVARATAAGEGHGPGETERGPLLRPVDRGDVQAAGQVAGQDLSGSGAVDLGVLGAGLVDHRRGQVRPGLRADLREVRGQAHDVLASGGTFGGKGHPRSAPHRPPSITDGMTGFAPYPARAPRRCPVPRRVGHT